MLTVYLDRKDIPDGMKLIEDVENEFNSVRIKMDSVDKRVMRAIDNAEVLDINYFKDMYGAKVDIDNLSTGCKAALCVNNCESNKVINLIECGRNALGIILAFCPNGNVLIEKYDDTYGFDLFGEPEKVVDIRLGNFIFKTIMRLNYYIINEICYGEPDLEFEGVERYVEK